jgi:hypothetical protein
MGSCSALCLLLLFSDLYSGKKFLLAGSGLLGLSWSGLLGFNLLSAKFLVLNNFVVLDLYFIVELLNFGVRLKSLMSLLSVFVGALNLRGTFTLR